MTNADRALARQALVENGWDNHIDIPKLIQLVRADEREACAKVADEWSKRRDDVGGYIARNIRARGQA
jgi:hypothetical protein